MRLVQDVAVHVFDPILHRRLTPVLHHSCRSVRCQKVLRWRYEPAPRAIQTVPPAWPPYLRFEILPDVLRLGDCPRYSFLNNLDCFSSDFRSPEGAVRWPLLDLPTILEP